MSIQDETATIVKRAIWDILQTYEPAGMKAGLVIANRRLAAAIAGQLYLTQLEGVHATRECSWSLASGTLPAGIDLSPRGTLSGRSGAVGKYPIVVRLTCGSESSERPLTLDVSPDTPPSIPDQILPEVSLDTYVFQPLRAVGGAGMLTWSVVDGKLPYGIILSPAGMLVGTPGVEGEFTFDVEAEDSNPVGPRAVKRQFAWKIGPARPSSLLARYVITRGYDSSQTQLPRDEDRQPLPPDSVLKIDGKLDEPFWGLDQPIEKESQGTPTKKSAFSAVWTANCTGNTILGRPVPYGSYLLGHRGG